MFDDYLDDLLNYKSTDEHIVNVVISLVPTVLVFSVIVNVTSGGEPAYKYLFPGLNYMYITGLLTGIIWLVLHINCADRCSYTIDENIVKMHIAFIILGYLGVNLWYIWIFILQSLLHSVVFIATGCYNFFKMVGTKWSNSKILPSVSQIIEFLKIK